ncbi:hypothetical protein FJZ31_35825 [Candidatus Poribacteria bacterium]|nr:hypothetical protein [Candidatus Poribacteria bacterium]
MDKKVFAIFVLNIIFVLMFCGCYSSMQQGQVTDGPNITFALHPLNHATDFYTFPNGENRVYVDAVGSMVFRYGWVASQESELGHSIGLLFDWVKEEIEPFVRGNYYCQFPKNSYFFNVGIGGEFGIWFPVFPLFPYVVISRDLGTRFTVYSEVRTAYPSKHYWVVPTLGVGFDVSKHFSLFGEVNLCIDDEMTAPVIGLGINLHRRQD